MGELGSDPVQLRDAASEMRRARGRLRSSDARVKKLVRSSTWTGHDADLFTSGWLRRSSQLRAAGDSLAEASRELDRHAEEQQRASRGSPAPVAGLRLSATVDTSSQDPARGGPPHLGDPLPLERQEIIYTFGASAMFGGELGGRIIREDLPGTGSLIWSEKHTRGFIDVGQGATATVNGHGLQQEAGLEAGVTVIHREATQVNDRDAVSQMWKQVPGHLFRDPFDAVSGFIGGLIAGDDGPSVTDDLVKLDASLLGVVAGGIPLAAGAAASTVAVGTRRRDGGTSLLVDVESAASLDLPFVDAGGANRVTLELPPSEGDSQPVIVHTRQDGDTITEHLAGFEFDKSEVGDILGTALDHVRAGNPTGAVGTLGDLPWTLDLDTALAGSRVGLVSETGIDGQIGGGAGLGVDVDLTLLQRTTDLSGTAGDERKGR